MEDERGNVVRGGLGASKQVGTVAQNAVAKQSIEV